MAFDFEKFESFMADDPLYYLEQLVSQDVPPTLIATVIIKLFNSKDSCSEENLVKFSQLIVEKMICESPLTRILGGLDTIEISKSLLNQFDFNKFLLFCRYLCSSDKQGFDIIGLKFFGKVWKHNVHFQYEIIKYCILSEWMQQILSGCTHPSITKKVPQIEILKCPLEYETDYQISCWKYQCLSQILLDLSENQLNYSYLEEIFFLPLNKCPDLLVFALLECHGNYRLRDAVLVKALLKFICVSPNNPNPNATLIIQKIWPSDLVYTPKTSLTVGQKSLLTAMVELYTSSSQEEQSYKLSKILDLSQDLKVLNLLLSSNTYSFVIDLACFASRREYLKLDKWLNDKIHQNGAPFVDACIQFLKRRCVIFGAPEPANMTLTNETFRIILNCLRHYVSEAPKSILGVEIMKMLGKFSQYVNNQNQYVNNQLPVNMAPVKPNQFDSVGSQQFSENPIRSPQLNSQQPYCPEQGEQEFSKEIEEEADSYFQRIYNQDQPDALTIDQFLEMLGKFQESSLSREKEIAACMIRNLFKEYPFLQQYPDKELVITGEIFGGIIMNNFVNGYHMITALRCVADSIKRPLASRYFTFGQAALNKMKTRLKEFPQFCNHLYNIPVVQELPLQLIEYIEYGKQGMDPPRKTNNNSNNNNNNNNSGNLRALSNEQDVSAPNPFQEKVAFIVNNLSQINFAKKAEEFKDMFIKEKDQYSSWFSNYFVKRVGLEANFHELYLSFMIKVNITDLSEKILNETYRNIKLLLCANKETDNLNDRTLLKNLGQWLGLITLAQNRPILTNNIDLRNLLIEAYHKGIQQLNYVVPFVTKVLMGSVKSRVFRPPCPWTVKLIKILVELHSESDLKLNLKFEVEVLCNNLDIKIESYVGKSKELKNKEILSKMEPQLACAQPVVEQNTLAHQSPSLDAIAVHAPIPFATPNVQSYTDTNLSQIIVIQPNLQILMMNPNLTNIIRTLIEKTVIDWIGFITERVLRVCLNTTETLVKKDFALEPNKYLMRKAARNMISCLVAGYSLINTEEPLMNRIQQNLLVYFQNNKQLPFTKELIDSTITTLSNDNIVACVNFVQKTCMERAIDEIEKRMKSDFDMRQNPKLECKQNFVSPKQFHIYEEMGRNIPGINLPAPTPFYSQIENTKMNFNANSNVIAGHNYQMVQNESASDVQVNTAAAAVAPMDNFVQIYEKLIKHLDELIKEFEYVHYSTEAMHKVLEMLKHVKQNSRDQGTIIMLIKSVIFGLRELFMNPESITDFAVITRARDFYLIVLKALADQRGFNLRFTTTNVTRFVIENWIAMNQIAFPDELFDTLFRSEFINISYMDQEFYQFLENGSNTFAINIILNFLKCYLNTINAHNFASTLELLQRIAIKVNQSNQSHPLINDLKNILNLASVSLPNEMMESSPNNKVEIIIKDWINCYNSNNKNLNQSFSIVVKNMNTQGLLKNDDLISNFFKIFLESCVNRCYHILPFLSQHQNLPLSNIHSKCYEYIDAFSVLVLLFIKQSTNFDQKFQFLNKILSILVMTVLRDQEVHQKDFLPLVYYRILLYIFIEFFYSPINLGIQEIAISNDNMVEAFKFHFIRHYCNVLRLISPIKIPSFSFAWLDFISHRVFIGKCLDNSLQTNYKTWPLYYFLLNDLLLFQKPILQNFDSFIMNSHVELYKGTLKLFLLLFHDFPEFLCEFCYNLCDLIPLRAVQLRNIILSANPISIQDVTNRKVDNLYEIMPSVRIPNGSLFEHLKIPQKELDSYILNRGPVTFLKDLSKYLNGFINSEKPCLNTSPLNALTLYVGLSAVQSNKTITINSITNSSHMEIFQHLLHSFSSQGRYILINSMTDHLRYPNMETLFFICLILALFKDSDETIQEQIIRVLLERIIASRPHPWGVIYVINELIRNPNYKLLEHKFIKSVPEIEKYFSQST